MALVTKRPAEILARSIDYTDRLPADTTVDNAILTAVRLSDGVDVSATVLVSLTGSVEGNVVSYGIKAGSLEEDYDVTITANLSSAHRLQDVIRFGVRDLATET